MNADTGSLFEVEYTRPRFRIAIRLAWISSSLVLFGPSGSGKTTLMRIALGLEPEARVRLRLAGTWLEDADRGLRVPVHARRLGWVPQSPTLFPDRNVLENIRFGALRDAAGRSEIDRAIEVLELGDRLDADVAALSGGERQRVALARAIASRPRALLLDEPLASLDLGLRGRVLPFLLRIREELDLPLIHITHDPDEAILLGDEVAVIDGGRLVARGEPRETLWSRAVLPLTTQLGVENLIEVTGLPVEGDVEGAGNGNGNGVEGLRTSTRVCTKGGLELQTPWPVGSGERLRLAIRAEDILIGLDRPGRLSARNICPGRIERIEPAGDDRLVHVDAGGERLVSRVTAGAAEELGLEAGGSVYLIVKSQALRRV